MMLTIHGLPSHVKYHDLKVLVKQECNINDFILDNLNIDGGNTKKVRIGVADESEGAYLIKCLDGFRMAGHVLRVVPVGKAMGNPQHNFDHGNNYSVRNDYRSDGASYNRSELSSSQSGPLSRPEVMPGRPLPLPGSHSEFQSHLDPMRSFPGPVVCVDPLQSCPDPMRGQPGPLSHPSSIVGRTGPMSREPVQVHPVAGQSRGDVWEQGSQWENHSQTRPPQQNNYGYQAHQGNTPFGQQNKPHQFDGRMQRNMDEAGPLRRPEPRAHVLRSVEIVDEPLNRPIVSPVVPRQAQAPITISKDNFQGPQFLIDRRDSSYQPQGPRTQNVPQDKPFLNRTPAYDKPGFDRKYQDSGPEPKRLKPDIPSGYDKGPRFSPRRDVHMHGQRESPGRRPSPGRRISPGEDKSYSRRVESPPRRDKPSSTDPYGSRPPIKDVRPAYEAATQAPKQALYSGGYRSSVHDNVTYPIAGRSQEHWQERERMFSGKKEDDRKDSRPKFDGESEPKARSPHESRSPLRHRRHPLDRSPPRDRFTKHSMSPRSPHRSWALEKRCSPEHAAPPPPPMWPGPSQDDEYRCNLPDDNRTPVWERPSYDDNKDHERRTDIPDKRREIRVRSDLGRTGLLESTHVSAKDTSPHDRSADHFSAKEPIFAPRGPKFEPQRQSHYMQSADLREPNFEPRSETKDTKFEPRREPKFEPRVELKDLKFEPRREPKFEPRVEPRDLKFEPRREPKFEPRVELKDLKFEPRREPKFEPRVEPRDLKFEPRREPKFEPRVELKDLKFEPRREPKFEPRVEPRDLKFEPRREPKFEPRVEPRDLKFEPRREPKFEPRVEPTDLKFEPRKEPKSEPRVEPKDLKFEPRREPKFELRVEPRDLKFEPRREPKFERRVELRDLKFEPRREPKFEPIVEPRDLKFESRREPKFEPRVEARDLKFEPRRDSQFVMREPKFEPRREPKFEPRREHTFETRDTKFDTRADPKFESRRESHFEPRREPLFEPRETTFELRREPVFEPRDPKFEPRREPHFEPRVDSNFEPPREPHFEPKNTTPESRRDTKFEPRQPAFEPRADVNERKFEPRLSRFDQRPAGVEAQQDIEHRLAELKNIAQRYDNRDPSRDDVKSERSLQSDARRPDTRREVDDILPLSKKPKSDFNKEFDDVYKRTLEFKQRVEEMRRVGDKRREESGEKKPDKKPQRDDERRRDHSRPDDRRQESRPEDPQRSRGKDEAEIKLKRDKAVEEISQKILHKHGYNLDFSPNQSQRLLEELKIALVKILQDMFHNQDVSFIEMVVKFNARFGATSEALLFEDVLNKLPSSFRKRYGREMRRDHEVPAKTARMSSDDNMNKGFANNGDTSQVPDWSAKPDPQQVAALMQQFDIVPQVALQEVISMPSVVPMLSMPMPINPAMLSLRQPLLHELPMQQQIMQPILQPPVMPPALPAPNYNMVEDESQKIYDKPLEENQSGYFNLYLCKDDFEPYSTTQAEYLKKFLVNQIIAASESSSGWTPDFTLKGLQSVYRYELVARDDNTRDWILKLDFSNFSFFNVLVYTKEELWYERAAIWLPGHSKYRAIEPLLKLKLQNSHLGSVNVGKWKMVKKVETAKGTRLYVDMPPSSARALEKHKMLLSYELQKVSVFLKAVAVDKDTFDIGLKESSVKDENVIKTAINNSPMPSLGPDPNIVKISLKGNKALNVDQARKIKERLIYHIFKYHQDKRSRKTDFVKFGFCLPGSFGVLPENSETRRWLENLDLGKLYKHAIVVLGSGDSTTKFIKMNVMLKRSVARDVVNHALILERLKVSNQGVKGLNFHLWKYLRCHITKDHKVSLAIDMDVESVDTLSKLKYKLDYIDEYQFQQTAVVSYVRSYAKLEELVKKYKSELTDSYDVANMELESDPEDEIVFMGEVNNM